MNLQDNSLNGIRDLNYFLFTELGDKRISNWFLMSSPWPVLVVLILYLYFCLSWGPKWMENRKPFNLKKLMVAYNIIQVTFSTWFIFEAMDAAWWNRYSWTCQPIDYSSSNQALREARYVYVYFLAKVSELLDTVLFVLRKKYKQISFLHLYHHTMMAALSWMGTKYFPGGHGTFICLVNTFVHIIMYSYYLLAAMGPKIQKYLWWKKYLTTMQMAQFCLLFLHASQLLIYDCEYPRIVLLPILPNVIFFYYLFNDFYLKAYVGNKERKMEIEDS